MQNPWLPDQWNVTEQGSVVRRHGLAAARATAAAAGSHIGATKPSSGVSKAVQRVAIFTRRTTIVQGSQGYAGYGPPEEDV